MYIIQFRHTDGSMVYIQLNHRESALWLYDKVKEFGFTDRKATGITTTVVREEDTS